MAIMLHYLEKVVLWTMAVFLLLFLIRRKHIHGKRDIFGILLIGYIVGICSVTVFPTVDWGINGDTGKYYFRFLFRSRELSGLNLIPLKTIVAQFTGNIPELGEEDRLVMGLGNLVGNVGLFVPVGLLLPLAYDRFKRLRSVVLLTLGFSFILENVQYFTGRIGDIDDVLLHLLGSVIGYGIWKALVRLRKNRGPMSQSARADVKGF